jgi:hypothetical protein
MTDKSAPDLSLCDHCPLNKAVEYTIANHERRLALLETEVKELLSIGAQFKLMLSLSIGGGGLSLVALITFIVNNVP